MSASAKLMRRSLPPLAYIKNTVTGTSGSPEKPCHGAMFCTGFMSKMRAFKGDTMEEYFTDKKINFLRFDYTDVGESVDENYPPKFSFKQWHEDALMALDRLTEGPQLLIGSSMGAWIALLAAIKRPHRVAGMLLIAPGLDFFQRFEYLIPKDKMDDFDRGQTVYSEGPFGSIPMNKLFFTESQALHLLDKPEIGVTCPVRILHATGDPYTPYEVSLDLLKKLQSNDVQVHLIKSDDHRMSSEGDLKLLRQQLDSLLDAI